MKQLSHLLRFLIYSNLFIAACAVLMAAQTTWLLLPWETDYDIFRFIFSASVCSYNFHYYFNTHSVIASERIEWQKKNRRVSAIFFLAGLAGAVFFFLRLKEFWPWLLPAVIATFLYSAPKIPYSIFHQLRKAAIGKTIFLAFTWMYVTTVLPVIVSGNKWSTLCTIFAASRFFFIYCIAIIFDFRDREDDKAAGVRSLITFLSINQINRLFILSIILSAIFTLLLLKYNFTTANVILLMLPIIILALLYNPARRNFSDMLYYVVLDGLTALSALLILITRI